MLRSAMQWWFGGDDAARELLAGMRCELDLIVGKLHEGERRERDALEQVTKSIDAFQAVLTDLQAASTARAFQEPALCERMDALQTELDATGRHIARRVDDATRFYLRQLESAQAADQRAIRLQDASLRTLIEQVDGMSIFFDGLTKLTIAAAARDKAVKDSLERQEARLAQLMADHLVSQPETESFRTTLANLHIRLDEVSKDVEIVKADVTAGTTAVRTYFTTPEYAEKLREVLRMLSPFSVNGLGFVRLGRANDGGYVMIDDWGGAQAVLSLGVNDNVSWDNDVAGRLRRVNEYGHSAEKGGGSSEAVASYNLRVVSGGDGCVPLARLIDERIAAGQIDLVLRINLKGDEWNVFDSIDGEYLKHFRQIVCEFHDLSKLSNSGFLDLAGRCLRKITSRFFVCHVHANNFGEIINVSNLALPDILEVTFANRMRYQPVDENRLFPTELDMPNQAGRADIFLGSFRF